MSAQKLYKVLVTHREVPESAIEILSKDCEVIFCEGLPPQRKEILEKSKGVDGILWATNDLLNGEVLDASGRNLKAISTMSTGLDYDVDIATLKSRRMPLGYTPINDGVADVALGLMIAAARRFQEGREKIKRGNWENWHLQWMLGQDIKNSTVGFLGFGGIAQAIAQRVQGFGVNQILYTSRDEQPEAKDYNAKKVSFDELCQQSDFIFIACPLVNETRRFFNEAAFNKMKSTSVLINVARGEIVDQNALYNALKSNKIFSAGIDEPLAKTDRLLKLPNLVVTPHIGSATLRTRNDMALIAAHNIIRGIAGEPMLSPAYVIPPE